MLESSILRDSCVRELEAENCFCVVHIFMFVSIPGVPSDWKLRNGCSTLQHLPTGLTETSDYFYWFMPTIH